MIDNKKEYICCAAIWYQSGDKFIHTCKNIDKGCVIFGLRHSIFELFIKLYPNYKQSNDTIQGFLTSHNRFVTRQEGAKIAFEAGQINEEIAKLNYLYSEDLY